MSCPSIVFRQTSILKCPFVYQHNELPVLEWRSSIWVDNINYYEHLQVAHLFDTMHIGKNVTETLWRLLEIRREKDKVVKACKDIQERNHAMKDIIQFHSNGDQININSVPWMFMEHKSNVAKEAMRKIKFPIGFCANLKNIITKKGDFAGVTHD